MAVEGWWGWSLVAASASRDDCCCCCCCGCGCCCSDEEEEEEEDGDPNCPIIVHAVWDGREYGLVSQLLLTGWWWGAEGEGGVVGKVRARGKGGVDLGLEGRLRARARGRDRG